MLFWVGLMPAYAQQNDLLKSTDVIKQHAAKIGLSAEDLNNYRISHAYVDKLSGATIYYLQQTYRGIDVLNSIQTVAIKNNEIISVLGARIANMQTRVNVKDAIPAITSEDAVRTTARHLNMNVPSFIVALKAMDDKKMIQYSDLGISSLPVKSKLFWVVDAKTKKASLSWQINVQPKGKADHWLVNVDATKNGVLSKINLNVSCNWTEPKNKNTNDDVALETENNTPGVENIFGENAINSAQYKVIPFPAESPIHTGGTPAIVSNPWELAGTGNNATTLKWHDDGTSTYNTTQGNNVLAQEDRNGNNGSGAKDTSTTASPDLSFTTSPDFSQQPTVTVNQNFGLANLFYWNNIMHDVTYQYGFDEVSGNFQANNQGRGGTGGDYVLADGLDGSGTDNANFATDVDGINPRMQMYLFTYTNPKRDGDLDNGVITHEYTHGISNRLTGGPSNAACLDNAEQMGEGWSDYIALMVTTDWANATTSDGTKKRPLGNYAIGYPTSGPGIRKYPYSTDMSIDPWTYKDIASTFLDTHETGEIWCSILWDMTWAIIQNDGINKNIYNAAGAGGNSVAMKLVMEGMKLQTCSPGFVDARDGILKADTLLYGGKYSCIIWQAFTRRGVGYFASQGDKDALGDEKTDFTSVKFVKSASKDSIGQNEQITYTFSVNTGSCTSLSNYKIVDTLSSNLTYVSSTGGTYNSSDRTVTFSGININSTSGLTRSIVTKVNSGSYIAPTVHVNEPFANNAIPSGWTVYNLKQNKWRITSAKSHSASYSLFAADTNSVSLTRFTTSAAFALTNNSTLSFWHYYNTENTWDGGRVEISTNNGVTYSDAGKYMILNGYQSTVNDTAKNLLVPGFSGNSGGFIKTVLDLSSLAGKSIKFRFVFTSDQAVGGEGWYIDDITLTSEAGIVNLGQFISGSNQLSNSSVVYSSITEGTLPVTWGEFTATKQGNTALLKWQTLQEFNTSHFIIQRSTDGVNFSTLNTVAAAGNSSVVKNYQFTDQLPLNGKDYYRIAQVDKDGKFTYSPARTLDFLLNNIVRITPNPAKDKIAVTVAGNNESLKMIIMDATGKQVARYDIKGQYAQFNLPNLAAGMYYVRISGKTVNHTQKLVIQ